MESPTYSSVDKGPFQNRFPLAAAMVVLSGIALSPSTTYAAETEPLYSTAVHFSSGGGFMGIKNTSSLTLSSAESNLVPMNLSEVCSVDDFSTPLFQGLQFIQRRAFLPVDAEVDKAIDSHFAGREVKTKKLFINPYKKMS